ncbi:hypothetical protein HY988_02940 [Candidatus Micrarchaeota archaeon]|nr:hypothetical protein [Candidatus Micrarchaeota archaeon]
MKDITAAKKDNISEDKKDEKKNDKMKIAAIAILFIALCVLAYFFLFSTNPNSFVPASPIKVSDFKDTFLSAKTINLLMDVRGLKKDNTSQNILQCGVDFAGSSGMGGKNVTYFSAADDGCTSVDGGHPIDYCFSSIKNGLTIYIHQGNSTSYYSNGMSVGVGPLYKQGTCGIRIVG